MRYYSYLGLLIISIILISSINKEFITKFSFVVSIIGLIFLKFLFLKALKIVEKKILIL